jgi:hypothetical protein
MANTKSSGVVFFRAVVMLTFLAAIPLLALSGSSLPDMVRKVVEEYWPSLAGNLTETTANNLVEAPPFAEAKSIGGSMDSVYASKDKVSGKSEPAPFVLDNRINSLPLVSQAAVFPARISDSSVVLANHQTPVETTSPPASLHSAGDNEVFLQIQKRLRALGATYYLLETWGNEQRLYRFYCQMAVAGTTNYTRCFEATHSDPIQAMRKVLSQVENWRAGAK